MKEKFEVVPIVSEPIGNGVVGFRNHLVCEEHVNDSVNVLLRDVLLKDRRNMLRQGLELSRPRLFVGFAQNFNHPLVVRVVHGRGLWIEFKQAVYTLAPEADLVQLAQKGIKALVFRQNDAMDLP